MCLTRYFLPSSQLKTKPGLYKDDPERSKYVRDLLDEEEMSPVIADSPKNVLRVTEFYSDRCPFCKSLASEYVEACKELKEKVRKGVKEVEEQGPAVFSNAHAAINIRSLPKKSSATPSTAGSSTKSLRSGKSRATRGWHSFTRERRSRTWPDSEVPTASSTG